MCRNNIPAKSQRFQQKHFTEKRLPMICKSKKEKNHGETNAKKKAAKVCVVGTTIVKELYGLGAMVCETLSENPVPVRIIGIPDEKALWEG